MGIGRDLMTKIFDEMGTWYKGTDLKRMEMNMSLKGIEENRFTDGLGV